MNLLLASPHAFTVSVPDNNHRQSENMDSDGYYNLKSLYDKNDFLVKNVRRPISSVYPSTTVAATTVATSGLPPVSSGWIGWHQYFKEYDEDFIMFFDSSYYKKGM